MLIGLQVEEKAKARQSSGGVEPRKKRARNGKKQLEVARVAAAYKALEKFFDGQAFTLRFSSDIAKKVAGHADPVRYLSKRLSNTFSRLGIPIPQMAFVLELTPRDAEPHLHGAIETGGYSKSLIKGALREVGGWIDGRAGSRQVKLNAFSPRKGGPSGWAIYSCKEMSRTRRMLGVQRIIYVPHELSKVSRIIRREKLLRISTLH